MGVPVAQFLVMPESDVDSVLWDLLRMPLPNEFPDQVLVAGLEVSSERSSDLDIVRNGSVVTKTELQSWLENVSVVYGWFFIGVPGGLGALPEPLDVQRTLAQCALVIDILEGRYVGIRTVNQIIAQAVREIVVGLKEIEPCDLEHVRLSY